MRGLQSVLLNSKCSTMLPLAEQSDAVHDDIIMPRIYRGSLFLVKAMNLAG